MKFATGFLVAVALSTAGVIAKQDASTLTKEDQAFWGRFLEGGSASIPQPPPTAPPTPAPTPEPTLAPTPEPEVPCFVEVEVTCTAEDGTECSELVPPEEPSSEGCIVNVCYTMTIINVGDVCMDITVADLVVNGDLDSVLDEVEENPLCPPDSTSVESCGDIDICTGGLFSAVVNVEAEPPNGDMCQADGEYSFTFPVPPTPPPTSTPEIETPAPSPPESLGPCTIELSSECTISGGPQDGQPCDALAPPAEICLQRPFAATMLFNGGGCEQSDNSQELKFTCADSNGGPPTASGEEAYIIVEDIKGLGIIYFEGVVPVGELFALNDNGDLFEADQFITIYTPDQSTVLQRVQYHSSCSRNLELLNRFGASQLVEFENELQGVVSTFTTVSFAIDVSLPISATSTESIELTSMTVMASFTDTTDLTDQVAGQIIGPDSPTVVVTFEGTINAGERMTYVIAYNVEGIRVSDGELCTGMDMITFDAGPDPNAPVAPPTDVISPPSTSEGGGTVPTPANPSPSPAPVDPSPSPAPADPSPSPAPVAVAPAPIVVPAPSAGVVPAPLPAPVALPAPTSASKGGKGGGMGSTGTSKTNKRR